MLAEPHIPRLKHSWNSTAHQQNSSTKPKTVAQLIKTVNAAPLSYQDKLGDSNTTRKINKPAHSPYSRTISKTTP